MNLSRWVCVVGLFLLGVLLLRAPAAHAQSGGAYELEWTTVDGGGAVSTGGKYALGGTVGQPDAGTLSGGRFELSGGFWTIKVENPTNEYTLSLNTVGSGIVRRVPSQTTYLYGDVVTLTATPEAGWYFGHWLGDASGTLTQTIVTMDADKVVTATFVEIPPTYYILTLSIVGSGVITPDVGTHSTLSGTVVDLRASPATGWKFDGWSGALDSTANPAQVTMDADKTITATFALSSTENTAPTISSIDDQTTSIGVPVGPLAFIVGDAETDPADLTLAGTSSNLALVPLANLAFSGNGANRAVTITPTLGLRGTATLLITLSDGDLDTSASFVLTVRPYQLYLPLVSRH